MVHLTTVGSMFEARVVMARLGAEGILTQLRGGGDGPYPLPGPVEVLVVVDQADEARELMLADQVEALFDDVDDEFTDDR
jgi:Putative prokaryotic signal transducing protein